MGDSEYVGLFMDFNIYKITETDEKNLICTIYSACECSGGEVYEESTLEEVILKVIKRAYLNNPFYESLLNCFVQDIKRTKRRGF